MKNLYCFYQLQFKKRGESGSQFSMFKLRNPIIFTSSWYLTGVDPFYD